MERLTMRNSDGSVSQPIGTTVEAAFYRLAAYEDTGLTPEEIDELLHKGNGPLHKKLGQWITADQEGRLVVLPPCKAGDSIFRIVDMESHSAYKNFVTDEEVLPFGVPIKGILGGAVIIPIECFGKNVFLTREEAEAVLEARKGCQK